MIKRVIIIFFVFSLVYVGLVRLQMYLAEESGIRERIEAKKHEVDEPASHKVFKFAFTKYSPEGAKEIEIEGDSANILTRTVSLLNVVAKAYAEETPVTITSDQGNYDKVANKIYLEKNVVATTEDGTRLLTDQLDIEPTQRIMETDAPAEVKKDNINIEGTGAKGDSGLKKVKFKKNVTVVVQDPAETEGGPTVITCDGPLVIDYDKNIAHFKENVVAEDVRGKLSADVMDVYYNKISRKVSKIVALGNVVIENPEGNKSYSDSVIYLADEGRIILGGDAEALYVGGNISDEEFIF